MDSPSFYNLFLRLGLVTDAGSGIPRTIARVRRATGQAPTLKLEGNEFVVVLPRKRRHERRDQALVKYLDLG